MYADFLTLALAAIMLGAAVGLYRRGRTLLAIILGIAVITNHASIYYIVNSDEVPGFTEHLSLTYRLISGAADISLIAQSIVVLVACWWHLAPQPNKSMQPTPYRGG